MKSIIQKEAEILFGVPLHSMHICRHFTMNNDARNQYSYNPNGSIQRVLRVVGLKFSVLPAERIINLKAQSAKERYKHGRYRSINAFLRSDNNAECSE